MDTGEFSVHRVDTRVGKVKCSFGLPFYIQVTNTSD